MRFSSSTPLSDGQTSAASIGGGVAGACIILAVILGLLCFYVIRRKGSKTQAQGHLTYEHVTIRIIVFNVIVTVQGKRMV
jgi:hypothetical protein